MKNGYFKAPNTFYDLDIFTNHKTWYVYSYLKAKANNVYGLQILFKGEKRILKKGQMVTGRKKGSMECHMPESTFWDQLQKLKKMGIIKIESSPEKSIITICKFDDDFLLQIPDNEFDQQSDNLKDNDLVVSNGSSLELSAEGKSSIRTAFDNKSNTSRHSIRRKKKENNSLSSTNNHPLNNWILEELDLVRKLDKQLTVDQSEKLINQYGLEAVKNILGEMNNYKKITSYRSVYLTALKWLKNCNSQMRQSTNNQITLHKKYA